MDELVLTASGNSVQPRPATHEQGLSTEEGSGSTLADKLVTQALQTAARITFVQDPALLADVGGVGALLRYRIQNDRHQLVVVSKIELRNDDVGEGNGKQEKQCSS